MLTVIGENIVDLVPETGDPAAYRAFIGGSPANIAVAAARLGSPTALAARVSRDVFGFRVLDRLRADSISDRFVVEAAESSSLAVVTFDAERRASYDFWLNGTADWQWTTNELPSLADTDVDTVHIGSLAAFIEPGASAIEQWVARERERGQVTISLDPNIRPSIVAGPDGDLTEARARVERLVDLAHVVKASDEDIAHLYPGLSVSDAAESWLKRGPSLVVITQGAEGAFALSGAGAVSVSAPKIDLADTVGAGDTFAGALLHGLRASGLTGPSTAAALSAIDEDDLRPLVTLAVVAAALNCTRPGANPPTAAEIGNFLS